MNWIQLFTTTEVHSVDLLSYNKRKDLSLEKSMLVLIRILLMISFYQIKITYVHPYMEEPTTHNLLRSTLN